MDLQKEKMKFYNSWQKGMSRNEIAGKLFISPETVKKHVQNIYKKLGVKNKIEALYKMKWL